MLTRLPAELLSTVCEQLEHKTKTKDLCSLARTSRVVNAAATPLLYADLLVVFAPETNLRSARTTHDFAGTERRRAALRHVKAIHFVADVYEERKRRCVHLWGPKNASGVNPEGLDEDEHEGLKALARGAIDVLRWIRDGALTAFSWELGTCIPVTVQRYLIRCQPNINQISLITGLQCSVSSLYRLDEPVSLVEKVGQQLKTLIWRSPSNMPSLQSLAKMLRHHAQTIEELDIDFIEMWRVPFNFDRNGMMNTLGPWPLGVNWRALVAAGNFSQNAPHVDPLQHKVFGLSRGQRQPRFTALRSLAFTVVPLREFHVEFAWAFNYIRLQRLTLRDCPGLTWTLRMLSRMREPLELKSLELVLRPDQIRGPHHVNVLRYLARFIMRLPKLENLFLMLRLFAKHVPHVWHALRLRGPLKKFVFHQRAFTGGLHDYRWIETQDLSIDNAADMMDMLTTTGVESLGLREVPAKLESMLSSDASNSKIKFLHVREPGSRPRHWSDDQTRSLSSKESERNEIEFYGPLDDGTHHDARMSDAFIVSHSGDSDAEEWEFGVDTTETDDSSANPAEIKAWPDSLLHNPPKFSEPLQITLPEALRRAAPGLSLPTLRFIYWAFGPWGLPDLQYIALGDFSHGRRYDIDWRFFARREMSADDDVPMIEVNESDEKLSSALAQNMDLLKACPLEGLFGPDNFEPLSGHGRHFPGRY